MRLTTRPAAPAANPHDRSRVIERLKNRTLGLSRQGQPNQRAHPRKTWEAEVSVTIERKAGGFASEETLHVQTRDISEGGFSFVCKRFLHRGAVVRARLEGLPERPTIRGVVRNCQLVKGNEHRIGVEFSDVEFSDGADDPPERRSASV